jgi:hypothetical protein
MLATLPVRPTSIFGPGIADVNSMYGHHWGILPMSSGFVRPVECCPGLV